MSDSEKNSTDSADTGAGRSAQKWDDAHSVPNYQRRFAFSHPVVGKYYRDTYTEGKETLGLLPRFMEQVPCERALVLCSGRGEAALALARSKLAKRVDGVDISEVAIEIAREKALQEGFSNLHFECADVNEIALPGNTYDLICGSMAMHHLEALEHVFAQVNHSLTEEGIFFASDYVGPTRQQWTEPQLEAMNSLLKVLPERYRSVIEEGVGEAEAIREVVRRRDPAVYLIHDPSEAVRSADILPVARSILDVFQEYPRGGTIIFELLRGIVHNFDENSEQDTTMLKLMCVCEELLIKNGILDSDFAFFFGRKRA